MLTVLGALTVQHCLKMRSFSYIQVNAVRESGGCALLLSCGLQWSFLGQGWEAKKVGFTWRRVFTTRDRQVVKDAVNRGQNWAAKQTGLQTSEVLSPEDRKQENRAEGKRRGLSPAFPLKTAGREQHSALQSGEAEVGRSQATYHPKVASSSGNRPSSEVFQQPTQPNCCQHCSAPGRAGTEAQLIRNLPCIYICATAAMNSIPRVLQETNMIGMYTLINAIDH